MAFLTAGTAAHPSPAHRSVPGAPGVRVSSYGRALLEQLRRAVAEAKAGDPLAAVTVVVPDNLTGLLARRALASGLDDRGPGVAGLVVTTLPRLADTIVAGALAPRLPATGAVVAARWRRALQEAPGAFVAVADHPATIRALVQAHHELRDLDEGGLASVAASGALAHEVVTLHRRVTAALAPRWYDETDLLREAAHRVAEKGGAAPVVLHAPQRTSAAEQELLRALVARTAVTAVVGLTGVERADGAVLAGLAAAGVVPAEPGRAGVEIPVATGIRHASDADDEVRLVVREVAALLETTPAHRIAVLYAAASPYARLLHERFAQAGIQVNGRGVRGVEERAIARGFLGLLRLPEDLFARAEVMRVLAEAPALLDGRVAPVSRWDRISRAAAVVEGEDWDVRLGEWARTRTALAEAELAGEDPRPGVVERHQRDAESAAELREAVLGLRARLADGAAATTWPALSAWASALFADVYQQEDAGRLPAEESYAAAAIASATAQLATLGEVEPSVTLASAVEVLELELERAVPRVGRFGEGVHVSPLGETAALDADVVIAVGLAEDSYPGRLREDALLGEAAREATAGLVPLRTRIDDRHRALLAALAAAPTALVTFPRGDLRRSTHRLPSRFVLPSLRHLAGGPDGPATTLAASEWDAVPEPAKVGSPSFASSLLRTPAPADEQEWRVRAAAQDALEDPVVGSARAMISARAGDVLTRYDGDLSGVAGLPDHATGAPVVAPTSLEQYADCPHAWFVQRLLRVTPLEAPEEVVQVSPIEVGNLVHTCLDRLVSSSPSLPQDGAPWSRADRAQLRRIFEEEADAAAARGVTGHPRLWQLERQALARDLERMLEDDDRWRASRGASVLASELTFGQNGVPPVMVGVPGGAVAMRGSADKVDRAADGTLLVTDVKTGKKAGYSAIEKDPVVGGTRLQLPVYAHAARAAYGGETAEAMYWFVRRDAGSRIPLTLDEDLERLYSASVGILVDHIARGWFPAIAPPEVDVIFVRCRYCNPDGLGHGERRERWERQRNDPRLTSLVALVDPDAADPDVAAATLTEETR